MLSSKVFCNVPWYKVMIKNNGHYVNCCLQPNDLTTPTINEISPIEWHNHSRMNDLRERTLDNNPIQECKRCYESEEYSKISSRIRDNYKSIIFPDEHFEQSFNQSPHKSVFEYSKNNHGKTTQKPLDYTLSFGNECNLACKMCFPLYSSKIATQYKKWNIDDVNIRENWSADDSNWNKLITSLADTKDLIRITIVGGEPMINKRFDDLLDFLIQSKLSDRISLGFVTNGTTFKQSQIDKLQQIKHLDVEISLESIYDNNHYIRQGSDTSAIIKNILKFKKHLNGNSIISLSTAPQLFSVNTYDSLIRWCLEHNIPIDSHHVSSPEYLVISLLPDNIKKQFKEKYLALQKELTELQTIKRISFGSDPTRIVDTLIIEVDKIIGLLDLPLKDRIKKEQQLVEWTSRWDKIYNLDARIIFPEYKEWLDGIG